MKKTISGLLALVFGCGVALGGEVVSEKQVKELEKMIEDAGIYVETAKKGVVLSGYVDASYSYNANGGGTDSGWNGTPGTIRTHRFDVDSNDFNVNQIKLALEKALPEENTWAAGFRVDLMFGEDVKYLTGAGENDPGLGDDTIFVEQAYVQFRVPVGNGLDFKFGKFVTLLGYEVIETPANLNVSRGYWFTYGIPFTHTGFLMSYKFNDMVDVKLGLVNGWNNSDSNFLDGNPDEDRGFGENGDDGPSDFAKAITAQIALHAPGGNADLVNSFIYSFEGEDISGDGIGGLSWTEDVEGERENLYENAGVFVWDIWGQWRPLAFNDKLLLAFNGGIGKTFDNYQTWNRENIGVDENSDTWWGAAVYAKYQLTDVVSIALRGEYFHDDDGTARVQDLDRNYRDNENWDFHNGGDGDNPEWGPLWVNSTDLWSVTATVGLDLWENMLCRLEYRLDIASSDGGNAIENGDGNEDGVEQNIFTNNQSTQHTFILNLSYSF